MVHYDTDTMVQWYIWYIRCNDTYDAIQVSSQFLVVLLPWQLTWQHEEAHKQEAASPYFATLCCLHHCLPLLAIAWCILQGSLLHNLAGCRALLMCIHPSIVSLSPPSSHSSALQTPQLHLCPQTPTQLHLPSDHPNYMLNFNCMLKLEGRVHCTLFNHPCFWEEFRRLKTGLSWAAQLSSWS